MKTPYLVSLPHNVSVFADQNFTQFYSKMEEMKVSPRVEWWQQNMIYPVRRVWFKVATRFGIRKNGLLKLRHDVRACECEDIQVMWEILNRNESNVSSSSWKINNNKNNNNNKKGHCWKLLRWARCAPYMCHTT